MNTALADTGRVTVVERMRAAFAIGKVRWGILALLFFATALNYVDRSALGVLQPLLAQTMNWSAQDYADINFWFQFGYAIGFAAQGRFIDTVGVKRAFALAVALWSVAAAAHGLAESAAGFMICRFFLGLTEAANYPACVKTTRLWFPPNERALGTGLFNAGTNVGATLTPMLLPLLLALWGWRTAFVALASLGVIWLVLWLRHYHDPETHPGLNARERAHVQSGNEVPVARVPYSRVLRLRGTWAFAVAYAFTVPVFWFYLYWLPPFLNQQYHLGISVAELGLPLIVVWLTADVASVTGGALSSYLIARGMQPVRARLTCMFIAALCVTTIVIAPGANSLWKAVFAIAVAVGAHQFWIANMWSLVMDYSERAVVASVYGFGGMVGALSGMFMTQLVGFVLTTTHNNYTMLFTMIPAAYFIGLAWMYFTAPRSVEAVDGRN